MAGKPFPKITSDMTEERFVARFDNVHACVIWLCNEQNPNGIKCKQCGKITVHHYYAPYHSLQCDKCGMHYQPVTGTIFQKKDIFLPKWFHAYFLFYKNQRIIPPELAKKIDIDIKTANFMLDRIRSKYPEMLVD